VHPPQLLWYGPGDYDQPIYTAFAPTTEEMGEYTFYYTADGSEPTLESPSLPSYSAKNDEALLHIDRSVTVKAFAVNRRGYRSATETFEYRLPKGDAVYAKCEEILAEIIKPEMTDLEKETAIHDYLVLNAAYDAEGFEADTLTDDGYTPYGLLIEGKGVCQAYAETAKLLLNMVGIECAVATGLANGGGEWFGHAWNIVEIDGKRYHLDVTFDDPVPDRKGKVSHEYFNLTDEQIQKDHQWGKS
jgi:transglutaminase-like putative cysteine protease